jgi:hypothetical protein
VNQVINPASTDESGQQLAPPRPSMGPGVGKLPTIDSPLQYGQTDEILGGNQPSAQDHLNPHQFPDAGGGGVEGAEGIAGAGEAAAGAGELGDLAVLAL